MLDRFQPLETLERLSGDPLFPGKIVTDPGQAKQLLEQQFSDLGITSGLPRRGREERKKRCEEHPFEFLKTYLPHRFHKNTSAPPPFASFHYDMWDIPKDVLCLTVGFRESAKSTLLTIGRTIFQFCYVQSHYTILGSYTEPIARRLAEPIMMEFETNPFIIGDFGDLTTQRRWSAKMFRTGTGSTLESIGIGQTPRGAQATMTSDRPDRACLDDLLTTKTAISKPEKEALRRWIFSDVLPALRSKVDGGYECNLNATMIDRRSLIFEMFYDTKTYPNIARRLYNFMDADEKHSMWKERYSDAECLEKKANLPVDSWYGEYQMPPKALGTTLFGNMINYYNVLDDGTVMYERNYG